MRVSRGQHGGFGGHECDGKPTTGKVLSKGVTMIQAKGDGNLNQVGSTSEKWLDPAYI